MSRASTPCAQWACGSVVVHTNGYEPGEWPDVEKRLALFGSALRLVHEEQDGRVYALQ